MEKSGKKGAMVPVVSRPTEEEFVLIQFLFSPPFTPFIPSSDPLTSLFVFREDPVTLGDFAAAGDVDRVRDLLDKGADPNTIDENRITALHMAADRGNSVIVQMLLNAGANVNAQDINDDTPLHNAALCGHKEVVELLLNKGADRNLQNSSSETAGTHMDLSSF